jgi:polyhydroxyalkanoate synthesis regulator phasin
MKVMANRRNVKLAVGGAAVAVVLVGLGAAGAIAASGVLSANEESRAVIEDAAQQLGVEPDALTDALKQGLKNRVDEALEAGRITEEQATALKERIDSGDTVPLFGGLGAGHFGHFGHFGQFASLASAADYLGLTEAELREQLRDKTLAEIARDEGKTVAGLVQALVSSAQKAIDEAVATGRLTEEQATELKTNLDDRIEAFVNGEFRDRGFGFHHRFRSGDASPRAPPFFPGSHT